MTDIKIEMNINTDNSAFCDIESGNNTTGSVDDELTRILKDAILHITSAYPNNIKLYDINGNKVGSMYVEIN